MRFVGCVAVGLSVLLAVGCAERSATIESAAGEHIEQHREQLIAAGFDLEEFESDVVALCTALDGVSDPDHYLAREAGGSYWFWSDDPEPFEDRNSPDELFVIADAVCGFDTGGALSVGMEMYSGTPTPTTAGIPSDSLDQMEIAFVGGHSRSEIKARIDTAMTLYGLTLTDDNYSRAGSVLVVMRQDLGPSEMDILDYMIRSHVPGVDISFAEGAALAASFLSFGDE